MNRIRVVHSVNVLNYLFLIVGGLICVQLMIALGDLLLYFDTTSLAVGIFSLWHLNSDDAKLRKVGLIWFIVNLLNIFVLTPLIIFVLFFGISF
ncbi:hypothetical protein [Staphylococcus delphini]|uniref:hypothetical protein n=1 Tax=Staphylococcus delphini TaxID=53344 RepID=UPI001F4E35CC|nr:hypothetical protein [Staphylococcus delphini]MDE9751858.1 hypothetical protein [Staphylococcus delphini]MDE9789135.1 hypothetical protein [Staphylococcus delphini]MDE9791233.1 hypothetical protein [Staphylococcus delphini]MDE9793562.1 hypothetical protein [Staphylococcus delphini]MDE9796088.1 hypothetical protein [Staphylococcus delphini]